MVKPKLTPANKLLGILESQWSNLSNLLMGELGPAGKYPDRMSVFEEALKYSKLAEGDFVFKFKKIARMACSLDDGIKSRETRLKSDITIECPVCYGEKKLVDTFKTSCNHEFCKDCLRITLSMKINCPYCTQIITSVTGDRFYYVKHVRGKLEVNGFRRTESRDVVRIL